MASFTISQSIPNLNISSPMPDYFLRPELGLKMYIAYGNQRFSEKVSTNLYLDMSDAVNCIVYVGVPKDGDRNQHFLEGLRAVDEAGCDLATIQLQIPVARILSTWTHLRSDILHNLTYCIRALLQFFFVD